MAFTDRTNPLDKQIEEMDKLTESYPSPAAPAPFAAQLFGNAGREHMRLFNTSRGGGAKSQRLHGRITKILSIIHTRSFATSTV
jgi:hypothetical protein